MKFKILKRRLVILWIALFILHFFLHALSGFFMFTSGLTVSHNPSDANTPREYPFIYGILSFPLVFLGEILDRYLILVPSPLVVWTTFLLNSAIWATVFYFLLKKWVVKNKS